MNYYINVLVLGHRTRWRARSTTGGPFHHLWGIQPFKSTGTIARDGWTAVDAVLFNANGRLASVASWSTGRAAVCRPYSHIQQRDSIVDLRQWILACQTCLFDCILSAGRTTASSSGTESAICGSGYWRAKRGFWLHPACRPYNRIQQWDWCKVAEGMDVSGNLRAFKASAEV